MKDDKKHAANYLSEDMRVHLKTQLDDAGINSDGLSDEEIVKSLSKLFNEEKEKRKNAEVTREVIDLNMYISGIDLNKELVERFYRMNIPKIFLKIFNDKDAELTDRQVWEKIHVCDVRQVPRIADFYKTR